MFRRVFSDLIRFKKDREGFDASTVKPVRNKPIRLWSMFRVDEQDIERLKSLVASARRLEALKESEGWNDIIEAKMYYQSRFDGLTKDVNQQEKERFRAACEWSALDGFFREISFRIARGREAEKQLEKIVKK